MKDVQEVQFSADGRENTHLCTCLVSLLHSFTQGLLCGNLFPLKQVAAFKQWNQVTNTKGTVLKCSCKSNIPISPPHLHKAVSGNLICLLQTAHLNKQRPAETPKHLQNHLQYTIVCLRGSWLAIVLKHFHFLGRLMLPDRILPKHVTQF